MKTVLLAEALGSGMDMLTDDRETIGTSDADGDSPRSALFFNTATSELYVVTDKIVSIAMCALPAGRRPAAGEQPGHHRPGGRDGG